MKVWNLSLYFFYLFTVQIGFSYGRAKGRIHGDFEFEDQVTVRVSLEYIVHINNPFISIKFMFRFQIPPYTVHTWNEN